MKRYCLLALFGCIPLVHADPAAQKVVACMRANLPPDTTVQHLELLDTNRAGEERRFVGQIFARNRAAGRPSAASVVLRIDYPEDMRGAAYLARQDANAPDGDFYLFLPSLRRVRRLTGGGADGSLLGTSISYEDLGAMQTAFAGATARLEPPASIERRPAQVLALTPAAGANSRYSLIRAWVDQKSCVPLKVEFYSGDTVRKRLSVAAQDLRQSGVYWYASELAMHDLLQGSSTVMRVDRFDTGKVLSADDFQPNSFYHVSQH